MIKKIEIKNFGKFQDQEINIDFEISNNTNIQLICGNNGSGKTTILTAIFLGFLSKHGEFNVIAGENYLNFEKYINYFGTDGYVKILFEDKVEIFISKEKLENLLKEQRGILENINKTEMSKIVDQKNNLSDKKLIVVQNLIPQNIVEKHNEVKTSGYDFRRSCFKETELEKISEIFHKLGYKLKQISFSSKYFIPDVFLEDKDMSYINYLISFLENTVKGNFDKPFVHQYFSFIVFYIQCIIHNCFYEIENIIDSKYGIFNSNEISFLQPLKDKNIDNETNWIEIEKIVNGKSGLSFPSRTPGKDFFRIANPSEAVDSRHMVFKKYLFILLELYKFIKDKKYSKIEGDTIFMDFGDYKNYLGGYFLAKMNNIHEQNGIDFAYSQSDFLGLETTLWSMGIMQDFILENELKQQIKFSSLSSGEQKIINDIIQVWIKIKDGKDNIILIDEPEQSLHPMREQEYIKLLLNTLSEKTKFQVILATHSTFITTDIESKHIHKLHKTGRSFFQEQSTTDEIEKTDNIEPIIRLDKTGIDNNSFGASQTEINNFLFELDEVSGKRSTKAILEIIEEIEKKGNISNIQGNYILEQIKDENTYNGLRKFFGNSNNILVKYLLYLIDKNNG